ncbi:MAG: TolC family protein [Candidatus Latescibacteria bacterium]|nr:TolC family protein [Candidatus Latescibacterota bacterium]
MSISTLSRFLLGALLLGAGAATGQPRPLTLDEAVQHALARNRTLDASRSGYQSAAWSLRGAYAGWLPRAEFSSGLTRINQASLRLANAPIDFIKNAAGLPPELAANIRPFAYENTYSTSVTLLQPLYNSGLEHLGIRSAGVRRRQSGHQLEDTRQEVVSRVQTGYYQALKAAALLELTREMEQRTASYLETARRKTAAGMKTSAEVLRWEVQLATEQGRAVDAENGLALAKAALNETMGAELEEEYTLVPPAEPESADTAAAAPQHLDGHPGLEVAKSLVELRRLELQREGSRFTPQLNLAFSYAWEKDADLALDGTRSWSTSLLFQFPINGLRDYAAVQQARADLRQAQVQAEDVERRLRLQAHNAALGLRAAHQRLAIARKAVEQAETNLATTQRRYEQGMAANIELLDAQTAAYQTHTMLINANCDLAIARIELERALGSRSHEKGDL